MFKVAPPRQGKTIEIIVERDASLVLKAPPAVTIGRATNFVAAKRQWVYRKLVEKDALTGPPVVKKFVEGEGFAYLGRSYRLTLAPEGTGVRLDRGRFHLPATEADQGAAAMRRWYTRCRQQMAPRKDPSLGGPSGRASSEGRSPRPRLPLGLSASANRSPTYQYPLGHPPTPPKPHRLHPRPRTLPPKRTQPHTRVLVHRRTAHARLPNPKSRSRRERQKHLAWLRPDKITTSAYERAIARPFFLSLVFSNRLK